MSKTQRELLMLFGILVLIGGILYLRLGRGGESSAAGTPPGLVPQVQAPGQPTGGLSPDMTRSGDQPNPLAQYPMEFPEPGLTDSAVAARITSGSIADPFARYRGRPIRTTQRPTQAQTQETVTPPPPHVIYLEDWPAGIRYQGVFPIAGSPGRWRARFNGRNVQIGERVPSANPSAEYVLVDASPVLVQIRWEDEDSNTVRIFTYLPRPPRPNQR